MKLGDARALAINLMSEYKLYDWTFKFQNKKCSLGTCSPKNKEIRLTTWYTELNDLKLVKDTILHEIAHALAFVHDRARGHGKSWKKWCKIVGATPIRSNKKNLNSPKNFFKYQDTCSCGKTFKKHRLRFSRVYRCPSCKDLLFNKYYAN